MHGRDQAIRNVDTRWSEYGRDGHRAVEDGLYHLIEDIDRTRNVSVGDCSSSVFVMETKEGFSHDRRQKTSNSEGEVIYLKHRSIFLAPEVDNPDIGT